MSVEYKNYIKVLVRKNLKMTAAKMAAQVAHAALGLQRTCPKDHYPSDQFGVIVLNMTDKKFEEAKAKIDSKYIVTDAGLTEIPPNTETALAYWEVKEILAQDIDNT